MSEKLFRFRGVGVVVDTTETAEFDISLHGVSSRDLEVIHRSLTTVILSEADRYVGPVRIREVSGFDVAFLTTREGDSVVITIGAIQPPSADDPMEEVLKRIGVIAMFRGAAGI